MDYYTLSVVSIPFLIYIIYHLALPKPLPGILYNVSAVRNLMGDIPAIKYHIKSSNGTLITFFNSTVRSLNAPLVQVFIRPLGKPVLLLSDFREAHSLLTVRKEFDRSRALGDLLSGLVPDHHIHLMTDAKWKAQRQLVQDLMMPSHLNNIAGPAIYERVVDMLELWRMKSRIANGRPWAADADVKLMSMDAMMAFAFGSFSGHSAIVPTIEAIKKLRITEDKREGNEDEAVNFPRGQLDEVLKAMLDLITTVMELHGSPAPNLHWAYLNRKPQMRRAKKLKDNFIIHQLRNGIERLDQVTRKGSPVTCAVDQMILRERALAEKDGRQAHLFSRVIMDELFGFVFAGNETTATTACWAIKFMADSPSTQTRLRAALWTAFPAAAAENRDPNTQEIVRARIPYLDATMEEILRCAGTSPFVDRQATEDTQILGHRVPRGTIVLCLISGPSMWSPGFDIDEIHRYAPRKDGRASNTSGRGNKTWNLDNMSEFQPERWLIRDEKKDSGGHNKTLQFDPTAGPQLAFGLGPLWRFQLMVCPKKLSSYESVLKATNEPQQCYVRLSEINRPSEFQSRDN